MVDGVDARYRVQGLDPGTRVVKNCSISNGSIDVTCVLFMLFIGCFLMCMFLCYCRFCVYSIVLCQGVFACRARHGHSRRGGLGARRRRGQR